MSPKLWWEYDTKMQNYADVGVTYYVIYNPSTLNQTQSLEVYRLVNGAYVLQSGEPFWMPGDWATDRGQGTYRGWVREWLYWYDQRGTGFPHWRERRH